MFSKTKICPKQKYINMEITLKTKKRLAADFNHDHTGGWGGGVSNTMIMIGNFRNIKGLT